MAETARTLPGGGIINDQRSPEEKAATRYFAVGTSRFVSDWGGDRRSLFALPCVSWDEAIICEGNLKRRGDMLRVRIVQGDWRPHLKEGDHLSIRNRDESSRHYMVNGFQEG